MGYWGPNLVRNFVECPETKLVAVCDKDPQRLEEVATRYPGVVALNDAHDAFARDDIDAVAVATPVSTHAPIGTAALEAGKRVLMEKSLHGGRRSSEP